MCTVESYCTLYDCNSGVNNIIYEKYCIINNLVIRVFKFKKQEKKTLLLDKVMVLQFKCICVYIILERNLNKEKNFTFLGLCVPLYLVSFPSAWRLSLTSCSEDLYMPEFLLSDFHFEKYLLLIELQVCSFPLPLQCFKHYTSWSCLTFAGVTPAVTVIFVSWFLSLLLFFFSVSF